MKTIEGTIILEGGASRGVFTAGVLDYLLEEGIHFQEVVGVSAGTCNALGYVARQVGRSKATMIHEDGAYSSTNLKAFSKNKTILDMDLMFEDFAHTIFPVDFDNFFDGSTRTHIVTTDCRSGRAVYHIEKEDKYRLMKLCRASSSLPLVTPIVKIDEVPYLDGGLADAVPIKYAQSLGNEKIFIVLTRNPGYRKKPISKGMSSIYQRAYGKKYPKFVALLRKRVNKYNATMDYIETLEAAGKIFVIRPQIPTVGRLERDTHKLNEFYNHGYQLMGRELERLKEYLEKNN